MKRFSVTTQDALQIASCIGSDEIDAVMLARAAGRSLAEISLDLIECVDEGLLVAIGEISDVVAEIIDEPAKTQASISMRRIVGALVPKAYRFVQTFLLRFKTKLTSLLHPRFFHDRCQQAAYSLIDPAQSSALHYAIGQRLVAATSEDSLQDNIFDFVDQLNHGIKTLSTTADRDRLARFNYLAARKASKSTAFEAARKYLSIAWDLLGGGGWVGQYELMGELTEALLEAEYALTCVFWTSITLGATGLTLAWFSEITLQRRNTFASFSTIPGTLSPNSEFTPFPFDAQLPMATPIVLLKLARKDWHPSGSFSHRMEQVRSSTGGCD